MQLDQLRSFFEIAERGSLSKAAGRLSVTQSTLTRQMDALEHDIGGKLLERDSAGAALTAAGHILLEGMRPLLEKFDDTVAEARKVARGQSASLRIGYIASAAAEYLHPALTTMRRTHPEVKVRLLDLSPGEQITALREGRIDLALIGSAGAILAKEFYVRKLASLAIFAALPGNHPSAAAATVRLCELREELFVGARDEDMPGYNRWVTRICRRAGFRPRFVENAESLTHGLATVVTEGAISLIPEYSTKTIVPGIVCIPVTDAGVKWDFLIAWQRGKVSVPVRAVLDALDGGMRHK